MINLSVAEANEQWKKTWPRIVARAWGDEQFLARLKQDPRSVASEYNLPPLENTTYALADDDSAAQPHKMVLQLPPKPLDLLNDHVEELSRYADVNGCTGNSCCV